MQRREGTKAAKKNDCLTAETQRRGENIILLNGGRN